MGPWGRRPTPAADRDYPVTCTIGGFKDVGITVPGTSVDDVRATFFAFLYDSAFDTLEYPNWRELTVNFNGVRRRLVFRNDWVAGFAITEEGSIQWK
jgi:hypothetical protein